MPPASWVFDVPLKHYARAASLLERDVPSVLSQHSPRDFAPTSSVTSQGVSPQCLRPNVPLEAKTLIPPHIRKGRQFSLN
ncbi:hypothetical protein ACLOJK_007564 [Asimina triloba]